MCFHCKSVIVRIGPLSCRENQFYSQHVEKCSLVLSVKWNIIRFCACINIWSCTCNVRVLCRKCGALNASKRDPLRVLGGIFYRRSLRPFEKVQMDGALVPAAGRTPVSALVVVFAVILVIVIAAQQSEGESWFGLNALKIRNRKMRTNL